MRRLRTVSDKRKVVFVWILRFFEIGLIRLFKGKNIGSG